MAPWFAVVDRRNGAGSDKNQPSVYHNGWKLEPGASDKQVNEALMNAARFQSSFRLAPYRLNAFDIQMAGTRRAIRAGFLIRSFVTFISTYRRW